MGCILSILLLGIAAGKAIDIFRIKYVLFYPPTSHLLKIRMLFYNKHITLYEQ